MTKPISENTPLTTALAISLCISAYWLGSITSSMERDIDILKDSNEKSTSVIERLDSVSRNLEYRMRTAEKRLDSFGDK